MEKGRLPETSNFDSPPGKAGGFPGIIMPPFLRAACFRPKESLAPGEMDEMTEETLMRLSIALVIFRNGFAPGLRLSY